VGPGQWSIGTFFLNLPSWLKHLVTPLIIAMQIRNAKMRMFWHFLISSEIYYFSWKKWTCTPKRGRTVPLHNNATHTRSVQIWVRQTQNLPVTSRRTLMGSTTWLGFAFTKFRYPIDFQENNTCNSCFFTISNNIQVKYCHLDDW